MFGESCECSIEVVLVTQREWTMTEESLQHSRRVAELLGTDTWRIQRLFEDGTLEDATVRR